MDLSRCARRRGTERAGTAHHIATPADNVKTLRCLNAVKQAAETGELVEL